MKKLLFFFMLMLSMVMVTSCAGAKFGVQYAVVVAGDGDGNVDVTFPQGRFAMDGDAAVDLRVSNDSTVINQPVLTKEYVLTKGTAKEKKALELCNEFMSDNFNTAETEAGGTYDLLIKGYVRETLTGVGFEVEKHLTNREQKLLKAPARNANDTTGQVVDKYQYIK